MNKSLKTPDEFKINLKNKIITKEMYCHAVFACNKSAKNCRDNAKKYRHKDVYANAYYEREAIYYHRKDILLSILEPKEIHVAFRERNYFIYDEHGKHMMHEEYNEYFLYFEIDNYKFHKPIFDPDNYYTLNIIPLWDFKTFGCSSDKLLSPQFVKKICDLILSGDYIIADDLKPFIKKNKKIK